jgi:uncharacterized protein YciW
LVAAVPTRIVGTERLGERLALIAQLAQLVLEAPAVSGAQLGRLPAVGSRWRHRQDRS